MIKEKLVQAVGDTMAGATFRRFVLYSKIR